MQATECIKVLISKKQPNKSSIMPLYGRQIYYDSLSGIMNNYNLPTPDPDCKLCGERPSILTINDSKGLKIELFIPFDILYYDPLN